MLFVKDEVVQSGSVLVSCMRLFVTHFVSSPFRSAGRGDSNLQRGCHPLRQEPRHQGGETCKCFMEALHFNFCVKNLGCLVLVLDAYILPSRLLILFIFI